MFLRMKDLQFAVPASHVWNTSESCISIPCTVLLAGNRANSRPGCDYMAIGYRIDAVKGLVFTTFTGAITFDEVVAHAVALKDEPLFHRSFGELLSICRMLHTPISPSRSSGCCHKPSILSLTPRTERLWQAPIRCTALAGCMRQPGMQRMTFRCSDGWTMLVSGLGLR